jgi:prepilin-type N-terminal cleavage/methylation domain-containing protein
MNIRIQNTKYEIRATRHAFSLTEVLIAIGLLAVGMLFVAGAFPVSIHFTAVATERTIAPIVADEAFAKYRIYSKYLDINTLESDTHEILIGGSPNDYAYPSTSSTEPYTKKYWWSAIFRRITPTSNDIQVTVFVSRKAGATSQYDVINTPDFDPGRPDVVAVQVSGTTGGYELTFIDPSLRTYINDGYTIVDDVTGQIYRVLERYPGNDTVIKIDRPWRPDLPPSQAATDYVWIISPPAAGGRYPCIGVYQKVM